MSQDDVEFLRGFSERRERRDSRPSSCTRRSADWAVYYDRERALAETA
jgi:hypothetical protein